MAAAPPAQLPGEVSDAALPKVLADLGDPAACHRALAALCLLMHRMSDRQLDAVAEQVPTLLQLLAAFDQPTVQVRRE